MFPHQAPLKAFLLFYSNPPLPKDEKTKRNKRVMAKGKEKVEGKRSSEKLPKVDDLFDALQGYDLFTTLDLRSGYWHLSVSPDDREKTAFVTPTGS